MKSIETLRHTQKLKRHNMKMLVAAATAAMAWAACATASQAEPNWKGPTFEVKQFDIDGVRLYMSADEVVSAINQKFGKGASYHMERKPSIVNPKASRVAEIYIVSGNYTLDVRFEDALNSDRGAREQVSHIALSLNKGIPGFDERPGLFISPFLKDVLKKYGQPTGYYMQNDSMWCQQKTNAVYLVTGPCDPQFPYMRFQTSSYVPASLVISDDRLAPEVEQYRVEHSPKPTSRAPL